MQSRREAAAVLAEELLADIELSRLPAPDVAKRASRLARLLDDVDAVNWLAYEMSGFSPGGTALTGEAAAAAERSGRRTGLADDGQPQWNVATLDALHATAEGVRLQMQAGTSAGFYDSKGLRRTLQNSEAIIGKVIAAVHRYVSERELELRFGAAVENAFTTVRNQVDAQIAKLAPSAAAKFSAAFENASSGNPEHWANAASACRRILKAIADELRPPGDPVKGRSMTDDKYINRLVDWISSQPSIGVTLKDVAVADLEDFGKRIDAFDNAGHKGAHAEVTKNEAARFITGAYLLIGDILNLWADVQIAAGITATATVTAEAAVVATDGDVREVEEVDSSMPSPPEGS